MLLFSSCSFCPSARSYCPWKLVCPTASSTAADICPAAKEFSHIFSLESTEQHTMDSAEGDFPLLTSCWTGSHGGHLIFHWHKKNTLHCHVPKGLHVFCIINRFIWSAWIPLCHGNFMNFEASCRSLPAQDILWFSDLLGLFHRNTHRIIAEYG